MDYTAKGEWGSVRVHTPYLKDYADIAVDMTVDVFGTDQTLRLDMDWYEAVGLGLAILAAAEEQIEKVAANA